MAHGDSAAVGLVFDDRYLQHNVGLAYLMGTGANLPFVEPALHWSNFRLVFRTKHLIDYTGLGKELVRIAPYMATEEDITVFHTPDYVERVRKTCAAGGGEMGELTPAGVDSYEIALLAAGGGMAGVDAVMEGKVRRVFANIRPPGHHAMPDKGMGFCIFSNMVIAARHAQRKYGLERIMILDWDVHHGNGTQTAFYKEPGVLFFSLHQDKFYPAGFGDIDQVGEGAGVGYNVNISLPPGSGDATYMAAFERIVLPIADEYKPELVLISSGEDPNHMDPLGRMVVTAEGFRRMTAAMMEIADKHANGRLVILQEGGYSELYAPYCALAIVETLAGKRTNVDEVFPLEMLSIRPEYNEVGPSGEAALAAIKAQQARYWPVLRQA